MNVTAAAVAQRYLLGLAAKDEQNVLAEKIERSLKEAIKEYAGWDPPHSETRLHKGQASGGFSGVSVFGHFRTFGRFDDHSEKYSEMKKWDAFIKAHLRPFLQHISVGVAVDGEYLTTSINLKWAPL